MYLKLAVFIYCRFSVIIQTPEQIVAKYYNLIILNKHYIHESWGLDRNPIKIQNLLPILPYKLR